MDQTLAPPPASLSSCWSNVLKAPAPPKPQPSNDVTSTQDLFVRSCKSSKGIAVAVVDANAIIEGGDRLTHVADRFVSVPEVITEVRDPVARRRLEFMPFSVDTMEPTPEALDKVIKFARATGDLQTLSDVDLNLIALTYTLEAQIHGTNHLRDCPPPVHTVNVKRLPEKDMPGWGSNVPNLEEWEALEHEPDNGSNNDSRILPLKDLNLNIPTDEVPGDGSTETKSDAHSENHEYVDGNLRKPRRYPPKKVEVKIEGKKMVADGIDASQGQFDDDAGDWMPAVSRSTHRRYLMRKARREYNEALLEKDGQEDAGRKDDVCPQVPVLQLSQSVEEELSTNGTAAEGQVIEGINGGDDLSFTFEQMRLKEDSVVAQQEGRGCDVGSVDMESRLAATELMPNDALPALQAEDAIMNGEELNNLEISSQTDLSVDASYLDDESSEQSWMLRSLSESTVACVTSDFAMQNVILQMGLRLLAPGGMQIRQLHRWILKCHACYTVTAEIGRIFCPKCGNGGTLRKVAVTVNENGVVVAGRRPRITLRGTKFSLPLPQGGRDAISKNLILREDQLPQKYLYPKNKKKQNKQGDAFFPQDDIFIHHTDQRAPFQPPVRKALAVFSGKRNPNDNHFSRSKRK